jgi:hypothetical protein
MQNLRPDLEQHIRFNLKCCFFMLMKPFQHLTEASEILKHVL